MTRPRPDHAPERTTAGRPGDGGLLRRIGPVSYAYEQPGGGWCVNNAGLLVGSGGGLLIDTVATERRARALRDAVDAVLPEGPRYLVNTHFHGDHTFGNHYFTPPATIIAHAESAAEQIEAGSGLRDLWPKVDWGRTPVVGPHVTYEGRLRIDLGDTEAVLLHPAATAHTRGDTVVWQPPERVLFTGDIAWSSTTPFCLMGSLTGSLDALGELRALEPATVVPGHGPVGGPEILDRTGSYLSWVLDIAGTGLRAGLTPLELSRRADLGEFARLSEPERLAGNLHRAYADLTGQPIDRSGMVAAFTDMVTLNGGLPACHA